MDEIKGSGVYLFCSGESILEYLPELEEMFADYGDDVSSVEIFTCVVVDGHTSVRSTHKQDFVGVDGLDVLDGLDVVALAKGIVDMDVKTNGAGVSPYPLSISRFGKKTYITLRDVSKNDLMQICYVVETGVISLFVADPKEKCSKDNLLSCVCYGLLDLMSGDSGVLLASAEVIKDFFTYPSVHFDGKDVADTFKKTWPSILEKYVDIRAFFEGELGQQEQRKALLCGVDEGHTYSSEEILAKYKIFCEEVFNLSFDFINVVGGKSAY